MSDDVPEGTHRTTVDWLGEPVLTLAHLWPAGRPRAAVVGLHPTDRSVEAGHHHQGGLAQRQLAGLARH